MLNQSFRLEIDESGPTGRQVGAADLAAAALATRPFPAAGHGD
jgi:hypothetical protein